MVDDARHFWLTKIYPELLTAKGIIIPRHAYAYKRCILTYQFKNAHVQYTSTHTFNWNDFDKATRGCGYYDKNKKGIFFFDYFRERIE